MGKITSAGKELISSGSFITFSNEPTTLKLDLEGITYSFDFVFNSDGTKKENMNLTVQDNGKKLVIALTNFDNSLGSFNTAPLNIGKINGRTLFLNFKVTAMAHLRKLLVYSFYFGEGAE